MDHNTTGDGMLSALQLLAVMVASGKPLAELAQTMELFPQILINVRVRQKLPLAELPEITRQMTQIEEKLGDSGRLLVRYSGTENKLRIMLEGEDQKSIKALAEELAATVRQEIGCQND
jgi:phosphoglucosamine mutase